MQSMLTVVQCKAWFTIGSYALFSYFMGFCNPLLKPDLLSISDCISDFKV